MVVTDVGGLAEVIQDGQTGYLVPPDDERALASALCQVLTDTPAAERIGLQGRYWVEQHYSWSGIACKITDLYRDLLGRRDIRNAGTSEAA